MIALRDIGLTVTLLALCAATAPSARAETAEELVFRARHARFVLADLESAIALYLEALRDASLGLADQAELHLQVARCLIESGNSERALDPHLVATIYVKADAATRRQASALRRQLNARRAGPDPKEDTLERNDEPLRKEKRAQDLTRQARRLLDSNEVARALHRVFEALTLAPDNRDALALRTEIERRIRGSSDFLRDPLTFLRSWTKARVTQVAQQASIRLAQGITFARKSSFQLAQARFSEAVQIIDGCELRHDSERLDELRRRIIGHWRELRRRRHGDAGAEPTIAPPTKPRSDPLVTAYLNQLQEMLKVVSSEEREYRIMPVRAAAVAKEARGWQSKPRRFALFDYLPTQWSAAQFALDVIGTRVAAASWRETENYLETSGDMLVLRNKAAILDAAAREVARLEQPSQPTMRARFLLVPVTRDMVTEFEKRFGRFQRSLRGTSPIAYGALSADKYSLEYIASVVRDLGADVNLLADQFDVVLPNGAGRHLFVARPLVEADGYESFDASGRPATEANYGVLIDSFARRNEAGQTALGLKLTARSPAPPLRAGGKDLLARFEVQSAEMFIDLHPRSHLVIGGLRDPFAAAKGERGELLLIWVAAKTDGKLDPEPTQPARGTAQVSMRRLLFELWDDPGPRVDPAKGFMARRPLDTLKERTTFFETMMRKELGDNKLEVDSTQAVVRVSPDKREEAAVLVKSLEAQSRERFSITIGSCAAATSVLDVWTERNQLTPKPMGDAALIVVDSTEPLVLRDLVRALPPDVYTPRAPWPRLTVRGLQSRHARSTRSFTSPALRSERESATNGTRVITEGIAVAVRPVRKDGVLYLFVEISTSALDRQTEEIDPDTSAPAYRTRVVEFRASGMVPLPKQLNSKTLVIRSIPHAKGDKLGPLSEIAVTIAVRALP